MHILLVTSEDLNEKNTIGSIFELSQAKSLQSKGIKTAIISVSCYSTINVIKTFVSKLTGIKYDYYRLKDHKLHELVVEMFKTIVYSLTRKTRIRKLSIQGVNVYEAVFNRIHFTFNKRWHNQWVDHGYKAFTFYIADFGKPNLIHAHSRFLLGGLLADKIYKTHDIKYILTEHSSYYMRNLIKDFQFPLIKNIINNAGKLLVVSNALGKIVNHKLNSNYSYTVVPNVLDPLFEETLEIKNSKQFIFLSISNLDENKNQQLLLRGFSKVQNEIPDSCVWIGGKGPEEQNLLDLAEQLEIKSKVRFLGHLSRKQVRQAMMECHVFVLPSKAETFGVVLIEAMACGKPVLATKCGGPEDIVDEFNGLLVEQGADAIAEAMLKIYQQYSFYDSMSIRNRCIEKYSADVITNKIVTIYKEEIV